MNPFRCAQLFNDHTEPHRVAAVRSLGSAAEVKAGEVVLVHAGASGVGTAAVQLARLAGAVPVVTAGSTQKVEAAVELGAAAGFLHSEGDFEDGVLSFTGGTSADKRRFYSSALTRNHPRVCL